MTTRRVLHACRGLVGTVYSLAFSPDSGHLLVGCGRVGRSTAGEAYLFSTADGQDTGRVFSFGARTSPVTAVAFIDAGDRLVAADMDGRIGVFDTETGGMLSDPISLSSAGDFVTALSFDADNGRVFAATARGIVLVFDRKQ